MGVAFPYFMSRVPVFSCNRSRRVFFSMFLERFSSFESLLGPATSGLFEVVRRPVVRPLEIDLTSLVQISICFVPFPLKEHYSFLSPS